MFISRFIHAYYFKKYLAENAVNTISEPLDFKIFWGGMPPHPPTNSRFLRSFSAPPSIRNTLRRPCATAAFFDNLREKEPPTQTFVWLVTHISRGGGKIAWRVQRTSTEFTRKSEKVCETQTGLKICGQADNGFCRYEPSHYVIL